MSLGVLALRPLLPLDQGLGRPGERSFDPLISVDCLSALHEHVVMRQ